MQIVWCFSIDTQFYNVYHASILPIIFDGIYRHICSYFSLFKWLILSIVSIIDIYTRIANVINRHMSERSKRLWSKNKHISKIHQNSNVKISIVYAWFAFSIHSNIYKNEWYNLLKSKYGSKESYIYSQLLKFLLPSSSIDSKTADVLLLRLMNNIF